MSAFKKVVFRVAHPCPIKSEKATSFGDRVSYTITDITTDVIDVDASSYNDPIAQLSSGAALKPVDTSNLLTSQDSALREALATPDAESLITNLENSAIS